LLSRVQAELAVALPLATVFGHASLSGLAQAIDGSSRAALPPIAAISREGRLPLSFAQQRLWFLDQLEGGSATYNIPMALRLGGRLDREVLQRSLDALFARHEALRTVFVARDGEPEVRLLDAQAGLPLAIDDLREAADREEALARLGAVEAGTGFDLERGPLVRGRLVRMGDEEHVLLLTMHHIVSDGWSMAIFNRELNAFYAAFLEGRGDPLPPLAIQYPDYAAWQREWLSGERLEAQADHWRRTMAGVPPLLELPTDRPRPAQQDFTGGFLPVELDGELAAGLRQLARRHGTTLFTTLLAAWSVVLSRVSGQEDVVIGTPSANRGRHEIEDLIGFFVNTLALRVDLSGEPTVSGLLDRVRGVALAAQDNQDLPFEQVVEIVQPPRRLDHAPLFQVMFAWQNNEEQHIELPGLQVQPAAVAFDRIKFDLELTLGEWGDGIAGGLSYATALFDAATIGRHRDYLLAVLRAMVADEQQPVTRIDILPAGERRLLLEEWNATEAAYPEHLCIHQ
ncbi:condensation domain-containing protein, partial [Sphingomonas sanguinis]